jgi:hypothetical protein
MGLMGLMGVMGVVGPEEMVANYGSIKDTKCAKIDMNRC